MEIQKVYKKGDKPINEDCIVVNERAKVFAAIDGATGLAGVPGYLASRTLQEELEKMKVTDCLYEYMKQANKRLGLNMVNYYEEKIGLLDNKSIEEIPSKLRSTSGIAAVKIEANGKGLNYVHAGDCMLFLKYKNGETQKFTYDGVSYFENEAIEAMIELREKNPSISLKEIGNQIRPILLANRDKLNTPDGYGIFDGRGQALNYISYGRISLQQVQKILLVSDGLLLPSKGNERDEWLQTAELAFRQGLNSLLEEVESREEQDEECRVYPRLKTRDDKTGILIELS
ncbi:hypothetical protein GLV94_14055 [Virgibacillus halodenitrificans]|uniref:hypothetical protein n=1 Tax=Virgibacillus halodenitrificans TaxID=1482 RepID=UPI00136E037E|nr:hypothetical protein [Virgibacillus halodenitrificans]MYL46770.1 hypothetical protein [Virgibacillus halodenitrificans]